MLSEKLLKAMMHHPLRAQITADPLNPILTNDTVPKCIVAINNYNLLFRMRKKTEKAPQRLREKI